MTAPDPRLDEIEDRLYAITTGPWEHQPYGGQNQNGDYSGGYILDGHGEYLISEVSDRDAAFIANAPADVAFLLAELRKAHEALARVEGLADQWRGQFADSPSPLGAAIQQVINSIDDALEPAAVAAAKGDGE